MRLVNSATSPVHAVRAVLLAILLVGTFAISGCSPEDLPDASPQGGGTSNTEELENSINPSQLPDSSFIYDATISSLEKADSYIDGQTVQVVGEVVGDRVLAEKDPTYCWITLEAVDGTYSEVAVYMTANSANAIDTFGAYGRHGTTLQVRGTFNLACKDHEGVSDLHATTVSVQARGYSTASPFNMGQVVPGLVLVVIGLGLLLVFRRIRENQL
ncbi:MAG: hydrolase [Eggerthellaceae bacterium]|nr:hydrolase [Eggerthellaceae bacterium]